MKLPFGVVTVTVLFPQLTEEITPEMVTGTGSGSGGGSASRDAETIIALSSPLIRVPVIETLSSIFKLAHVDDAPFKVILADETFTL
jgi:hypothetical protein